MTKPNETRQGRGAALAPRHAPAARAPGPAPHGRPVGEPGVYVDAARGEVRRRHRGHGGYSSAGVRRHHRRPAGGIGFRV